jgi:TRAP-type mannitol/chloroaromatic compound transport system permease large subunit
MIMPPIGMNGFVMNSLARDVPLWTIYKGLTPFVLSDFVRLAILPSRCYRPIFPHACEAACRSGRVHAQGIAAT